MMSSKISIFLVAIFVISINTVVFAETSEIGHSKYIPPVKQLKSGIDANDISCREGFELVINPRNIPACVKPSTATKLLLVGWKSPNSQSTKIVTLGDNGKTIDLKTGDSFLLKLGENYDWDIHVSNETVVSRAKNIMVIRGAQGIYDAHVPGNVILSATGNPECLKAEIPCRIASILFTTDIKVTPKIISDNTQIANPASIHCIKNGGKIDIRETVGGQQGFCVFSDGSECDEWKFFRGECNPGQK